MPKKSLKSRLLTWTLRLLTAGIVLLILAAVLVSNLSGHGEVQKKSLEEIARGILGYPVEVHDLKDFSIFPRFNVEFGNLVATAPDGGGPTLILAHYRHTQDSWQKLLWGRHVLYALGFENLLTAPEFLGPYSLHLLKGGMEPLPVGEQKGSTRFRIDGNYGGTKLTLALPVRAWTDGGEWKQEFEKEAPLTLDLGDWHLAGKGRREGGGLVFDPLDLTVGGKTWTGRLDIPLTGERAVKIHVTADGETLDLVLAYADRTVTATGTLDGVSETSVKTLLAPLVALIRHPQQTDESGKTIAPVPLTLSLTGPCGPVTLSKADKLVLKQDCP